MRGRPSSEETDPESTGLRDPCASTDESKVLALGIKQEVLVKFCILNREILTLLQDIPELPSLTPAPDQRQENLSLEKQNEQKG